MNEFGMDEIDKDTMFEVCRELRLSWSEEQLDAHWEDFMQLKKSVERGRRKHQG